MTRRRKVFLIESDISQRRIFLQVLSKLNCETKTFQDFDVFIKHEPEEIDLLIISYNDVPSLTKIKNIFSKYKKINSDTRLCIIADKEITKFPCLIIKPIQNGFLIRRLETEFLKIETKPTEPNFNFVGVAIASSTGGPLTLQHYFENLEYTEKAAYFLVLHAPDWMLQTYAKKLDSVSHYTVQLAENNMDILPGNVYIAPGNFHMKIDKVTKRIKLNKDEPYNFLRPAADPTFFSVAESFTKKALGIVFTGMGNDGTIGASQIHASGGKVLVQSPETAVIYSMPKSVIEVGVADKVVPIEKMPEETIKLIKSLYVK